MATPPSSFTVTLDPSGRLLRLEVIGEIGAPGGGLRDTLVEVGLGDSDTPVIVDMRRAVLSGAPDAQATLRDRLTRWAASLPQRRIALVAIPGASFELARAVAGMLEAHGFPSQVFADDEAARDWVTAPRSS